MSVNLKKANNLVVSYPKEPTKFLTFFALTSKKFQRVVKTKDKSTKMIIWCYLTQQNTFIFMIWPLLEAWAKKCEKFCWFFGVWEDKIICFRDLPLVEEMCQSHKKDISWIGNYLFTYMFEILVKAKSFTDTTFFWNILRFSGLIGKKIS